MSPHFQWTRAPPRGPNIIGPRSYSCVGILVVTVYGVSKTFRVLRCRLDEMIDSISSPDENLCADVSNLSLNTDETKSDVSTPACNGLGSTDLGSTTTNRDPVTPKLRTVNSTSNDTQLVSSDSLPPRNNTQQDLSVSQPPNPITLQSHLCIVCGCSGPKRCGKCAQAHHRS